MVLEDETKIVQSKNAHTQYLVIPSALVQDSQYPFKNGDTVKITVDPKHQALIITPVKEKQIKISSEGALTK